MRSLPAFRSSSHVLLCALTLGACATHQPVHGSPGKTDRIESPTPAASAVTPSPVVPQDRDYSVSGLFRERHADTLSKARGYDPDLVITGFAQLNQEIKDTPGSWDSYEFHLDGKQDSPIDPDSWIRTGVHAHTRNFQFSGPVTGAYANERLYELGLVLGGGRFLDDNTFVELSFEPGLYSDLDGTITSKDWQFFGHLHATWRYDDHLFFKGGIRTDRTFDDLDVYPQAGVMVQMHEQWRFDMLLPNYLELQWNPAPEFILSVGADLTGNDYAIRESVPLGQGNYTWRTQDLRLYLGAIARLDDAFSIVGRFGGTVAGDYEFNGSGGQSSGTPAGSVFFEVGLGLDW